MSDQLRAEVVITANDAPATQSLNRFSKNAVTQIKNVDNALKASNATMSELSAALKRAGGGDVAQKLTKQVALTKEEYQKVRQAIAAVVREQEKLAAAADKAAKKVAQKKEAAQGRADITTEAVKVRKAFEENEKRQTATHRAQLRERERAVRAYEATIARSLKLSQDLQNKVTQAISGTAAAQQRLNMLAGGMTPHQALFQQLQPTMGFGAANWLAAGGRRPSNLPLAGGTGGGGFNWRQLAGTLGFGGGGGALGSLARNVLGGFGVGAGAYGVANAVSTVANSVEQANAYDRMEIAAKNLAGTQGRLNELLIAYRKASGGAIDDVTALENVVRLQATGFAKSAEQVEKFIRGARGASIALGKPQDYITQETQLAISNTSVKRLDQIGLGIAEVNGRIDELRANNKELTREMAFQEAVITLLNEKYGGLTDTVEGQATGLEKLSTAWSNAGLKMGQVAQGPVNQLSSALALMLNVSMAAFSKWVKEFEFWSNMIEEANRKFREHAGTLAGKSFSQINAVEQTRFAMPNAIVGPGFRGATRGSRFDEEETAAIVEWSRARADIERNANRALLEEYQSYRDRYRSAVEDFQLSLIREEEDFNRSRERQAAESARQMAEVQEDAVERETKAARDLADAFAKLDRDFQRSMALAERDLSRSLEKMAEERSIRQRQQQEDHDYDLEQSRKDSLDRLSEMQADYDERVAEEREDSNERLTELDEEFAKEKERAERDALRSMSEAAANLDARGVWMAQRRFKDQQEEAERQHQEDIEKEKKRLADFEEEANKDHEKAITKEKERQAKLEEQSNAAFERQLERENEQYARQEANERAAHEQRISDAREALEIQRQDMLAADEKRKEDAKAADEARLEDIQEAISLQQAAEDDDRRIRLERMEQDHNKQLTEMTRQHNLRIKQIGDHAQEERDQLDEEFKEQMTKLGAQIDGYQSEYDRLTSLAMTEFDDFMIHVREKLYEERTGQKPPPNSNAGRIQELEAEYQHWDSIRRGYAQAHNFGPEWQEANDRANEIYQEIQRLKSEGQPSSGTASLSMVGAKVPSVAGGVSNIMNGGASIIIAAGAIQITGVGGNIAAAGDEFEARLLKVLKRVTRTI